MIYVEHINIIIYYYSVTIVIINDFFGIVIVEQLTQKPLPFKTIFDFFKNFTMLLLGKFTLV